MGRGITYTNIIMGSKLVLLAGFRKKSVCRIDNADCQIWCELMNLHYTWSKLFTMAVFITTFACSYPGLGVFQIICLYC